ncbi:MAG: hypothetical protein F4082_06185, partial [Gammaproteobacteria bacterium]|nr:hypothetical protein [Gammaproteobacteria bacterium]
MAVDRTIDADLFLHEGGYSHGPLAGHKIHCDHELYEANLSKRDIPYLTHHKVQLSAIMPAAGYIELVLEALNGQPVHFEEIEFILPCPIPEIPVRLQTALRSTPGLSTQYSFAISSRPVPTEPNSKIESELHCRGQVQLLEKNHKVDVPENLSNVDTSGFVTVLENPETGETEFYDRMEATLGKQFEYGPQFRTLKQIKINQTTLDYLIEVELDEQMWETGNAEGYVLCPPLVDGVLQIFAYNLMQATDLYGFPLRVKNTTFLGKPTTPRITAHVSKSLESHLTTDMLAQLTLPIGEISAGDLRFYDSVTGELFLRIEQYIFFAVNSNWTSISKSKHIIDWQPKFMEPFEFCEDSPDESPIELEALITDLACSQSEKPRRLHIVELAGNRDPEQTMLNRCVASLSEKESQIEYWMVNNTSDQTKACYEFFHKHNLPLRFAAYDEESLINSELKSGLLRICAANILVLHREDNDFKDEDWEVFRRLAVTGGLALISHSNTEQISPPAGWRIVGVANNLTLLQAQHMLSKVENVDVSSKSRLVIGDWNNAISKWRSCINQDNMSASYAESTEQAINRIIEKYETSDRFNEIDYFFRNTSDDPTGEQACARLVELVQCLIHYQIEEPNEVCRINVVTQNAAMNIQNPGSTSLWGIARAMAVEIGNESGIEIRLYDIETLTDMDTLAWLVQNDVREREIAIRDNQIWAPRLVHMRDWYPQVCSMNNVAYFLSLEHPGQLNGLQFKTRHLPELGDNDVEVKVEYSGLNFRDVMVTLGMLPTLAYERSM